MNYTPAHLIPVSIRRHAAAEHEAGHVLVAIRLGREVTGAILLRPDGLSGETRFANTPAIELDMGIPEDRRTIEDAIIVLMAGRIAESRYWNRISSLYRPFIDSHRDDDAEIELLRSQLPLSPDGMPAYTLHCETRTSSILDSPRAQAAVEEIASVLWERFEIERPEVDAILEKHDIIVKPAPTPA